MKNLIILGLFIFPFSVGCSVSADEEKKAFMEMCTIVGDSPRFITYCECCYSHHQKHGAYGSGYINGVNDCMSLLY